MPRKSLNRHTPAEVVSKNSKLAEDGISYLYRVVRLIGAHGKHTTVSFDWMESLVLLRGAGWTEADFKDKTRELAKQLIAAGVITTETRYVSRVLWKALQAEARRVSPRRASA